MKKSTSSSFCILQTSVARCEQSSTAHWHLWAMAELEMELGWRGVGMAQVGPHEALALSVPPYYGSKTCWNSGVCRNNNRQVIDDCELDRSSSQRIQHQGGAKDNLNYGQEGTQTSQVPWRSSVWLSLIAGRWRTKTRCSIIHSVGRHRHEQTLITLDRVPNDLHHPPTPQRHSKEGHWHGKGWRTIIPSPSLSQLHQWRKAWRAYKTRTVTLIFRVPPPSCTRSGWEGQGNPTRSRGNLAASSLGTLGKKWWVITMLIKISN